MKLRETTNKKKSNDELVEIHTGTNDLSSNFTPTDFATNIINLAAEVKINFDQSRDVIVSSIAARGDQLNQKATDVNEELKELCLSKNIRYLNHTNIYPRKHLNR